MLLIVSQDAFCTVSARGEKIMWGHCFEWVYRLHIVYTCIYMKVMMAMVRPVVRPVVCTLVQEDAHFPSVTTTTLQLYSVLRDICTDIMHIYTHKSEYIGMTLYIITHRGQPVCVILQYIYVMLHIGDVEVIIVLYTYFIV